MKKYAMNLIINTSVIAAVVFFFFVNALSVQAVDETTEEQIVPHEFQGGGVAQGWHGDDSSWSYDLPFTFNFYGVDYETIYVNSNGAICFSDYCDSTQIELNESNSNPMIAPLSMDLRTDRTGNDIFITDNGDHVIVRWDVVQYGYESNRVNFEVVLYDNGNIKMNYGEFLLPLNGAPVVGISKSDGSTYTASVYNGQTDMNNADTSIWGSFYITTRSFLPASGSNTVAVDENFSMTFDRDVQVGSGNVEIKKYSDDSTVETIDITSAQITGWHGSMITINPANILSHGVQYYITIDAHAVTDGDGTEYSGITDKDDWMFTVRPAGNTFDFDDTFGTQNFIDDENTDAYWDQENGLYTLGGAGGVWTYADRETLGKEALSENGTSPKIALNDAGEQMSVWADNGIIMFARWDGTQWGKMNGDDGVDDISTDGMICGQEGGGEETCGDGFCDFEAGENTESCYVDCAATYYLSQVVDGKTEEKHSHHFPVTYEGKNFSFTPENNALTLRIIQKDAPFADIDQLELSACGEVIMPDYAYYVADNQDILDDIKEKDLNVIVAHEKEIEISWDIPESCTEDVELYMYANEYGHASPFMFRGEYTLGEKKKYAPLWKPSTGHPDGYTYMTITDDDEYIHYDLDITMDNTDDQDQDWLEVRIGDKVFRVDDNTTTYGTCPFGKSDKVEYKHQLCELHIPKSEIDIKGDIDFSLRYYGTGGTSGGGYNCYASQPEIFVDNDGNPVVSWIGSVQHNEDWWDEYTDVYVRKWDDNAGEWVNMHGDTVAEARVFEQDLGDISGDYDDVENYHMIKSSDGYPMIASIWALEESQEIVYAEWNNVGGWSGKNGGAYDHIDYSYSVYNVRLDRNDQNNPMIVWRDDSNGILFTHWDGSGYVSMIDPEIDYDVISNGYSYTSPQIVVDSNGDPVIAYSISDEAVGGVSVHEWSGDGWIGETILHEEAAHIRLALLSNDDPIMAWAQDSDGVKCARFDGTNFSNMDGSDEYDVVENVGDEFADLEMVITSNDRPMIVWSLFQASSAHFKQWNNSAWVGGDGVTDTSDDLSGEADTRHTDMVINGADEPSVVWREPYQSTEVNFSMLPLEVVSPRTVQSAKINGSITDIVKAQLSSTAVLEGESYIRYFLSGDGGMNWIEVNEDEEKNFDEINDLRWRADLYAGSVPTLYDVHVDYETASTDAPVCGEAAQTYAETSTNFSGSFCSVGVVDVTPTFPDHGQTVTWNCGNDELIESCSASRANQGSISPVCGEAAQTYAETSTNFSGSFCSVGMIDITPAFPDHGQTVTWNCENDELTKNCSAKKDEKIDEEKECSLDSVKDVTNESVTLRVSVDRSYADEKVKFKIDVENVYTDKKETIKLTGEPTDSGKTTLVVDHLEENTEYRFKVSYDESDVDEYLNCPHAKTAKTDTKIVGPYKEKYYPECGEAATSYTAEKNAFIGDFCAKGTETATPTFPQPGEKATWTCEIDGNVEDCHAIRDKMPMVVDDLPVVKGGVETVPDPEPKKERSHIDIPEKPAQAVATAGLVIGSTIAFATSAVPLFATMPMAAKDIFIMPFLGLLARRKNERNWGTVFEGTTKQPIAGVKLTLTDPTGKEIETTYSDQHGRFGFLTQDGTYVIESVKAKYKTNFENRTDPLYGAVYAGDPIHVQENKMITINIAMNALNINWAEYAHKKSQAYNGVFSMLKKWGFIILFYAGFAFTGVIAYLYPSAINVTLLMLYVALFVYDHFVKKKEFGTVETDQKNPVPFAIVSLHDKTTNEKKKFAVTDVIGRYYLLSENGSYVMKVKGQPVGGRSFEKQGEIHVRDGLVRKKVTI